MNSYDKLKGRQAEDVEKLPIFYAFSKRQFEEGMIASGLQPTDVAMVCPLGNTGGYCKITDVSLIIDTFERHDKEIADAIACDVSGSGFIFDMFKSVLDDLEYNYTRSTKEALEHLGFTDEDIKNNAPLSRGLALAIKACRRHAN